MKSHGVAIGKHAGNERRRPIVDVTVDEKERGLDALAR